MNTLRLAVPPAPLSDHFASLCALAGIRLAAGYLGFDQYRSIVLAAEAKRVWR